MSLGDNRIEELGFVYPDFLRNIVGGEIEDYTRMLTQGRDQAIERMVKEAESLGTNAVVGVRFTTSQTMSGAAEILAYGTAVRLKE